jgi:hypothetical protein
VIRLIFVFVDCENSHQQNRQSILQINVSYSFFIVYLFLCFSLQWKWNKSNNVSTLCTWLEFAFSIVFNNWIDDFKHCQTINTINTQKRMLRDCKSAKSMRNISIHCWKWRTHQTKHSSQLICEQVRLSLSFFFSLSQQSFSTTQTHFLTFSYSLFNKKLCHFTSFTFPNCIHLKFNIICSHTFPIQQWHWNCNSLQRITIQNTEQIKWRNDFQCQIEEFDFVVWLKRKHFNKSKTETNRIKQETLSDKSADSFSNVTLYEMCWQRENVRREHIRNKTNNNIWWVSSIILILLLLLLCLFVLFHWNGTQTQLKELSTLIKHKQIKWIQLIVVNNNLV